jgi:DNA-binding NarL/FixJ family response regulator
MTTTRILVLDGQPLTAAGIALQINGFEGFHAQSFIPAETTFDCICAFDPHVTIIHPHHTDTPTIHELYRRVAACEQRMSLLLLSGDKCDNPRIQHEAFDAGIDGVLDRDTVTIDTLIEAIKRLAAEKTLWEPQTLRQMLRLRKNELMHQPHLAVRAAFTPREREIFTLLATGVTNKAIANELNISERTVEGHVRHIITKLGVCSRTEVIAVYYRLYSHDGENEQELSTSA